MLGINTHVLSGISPQPVLGGFLIVLLLLFVIYRLRLIYLDILLRRKKDIDDLREDVEQGEE